MACRKGWEVGAVITTLFSRSTKLTTFNFAPTTPQPWGKLTLPNGGVVFQHLYMAGLSPTPLRRLSMDWLGSVAQWYALWNSCAIGGQNLNPLKSVLLSIETL